MAHEVARNLLPVDALEVQTLVDKGIGVVTACFHAGVINVLKEARNVFGHVLLHRTSFPTRCETCGDSA